MGLWRVLFLAGILFVSVKVPGFFVWSGGCWFRRQVAQNPSGRLETCRLQVQSSWRLLSGREPVRCPLGTCATSGLDPMLRPAQCASGQSYHFDLGITAVITSRVIMWGGLVYVSDASLRFLPRSAAAAAAVAHDVGVVTETLGVIPFTAFL
jgi:hypothetical protein